MKVLPVADSGLLVELPDPDQVLSLYRALSESRPAGVTDIVPAARTVLLTGDAPFPAAAVARAVRALDLAAVPAPVLETVEMPVVYDGPDLDHVGQLTGLGVEEIVRLHLSSTWQVAFTGFAPGFGYLSGGDPRLQVPRRDEPRTRVAAGAVALAGPYCGIYPRESPGGWQLIARTDQTLWDARRDPAALLRPGVRVRFRVS